MRRKSPLKNLECCGQVKSKKQVYDVYRGLGFFVVASASAKKPNAGNFNIVPGKDVEIVCKRFAGMKGVTKNDVVDWARKSKKLGPVLEPLVVLNILYVLVGIGQAIVDGRYKGRALVFNVHT